jgi:acyl carrier protein
VEDDMIEERVRAVFGRLFEVDPADLPKDFSAETEPRWTSLRHLMLLMAVEDEFGCPASPDLAPALVSLPAIVEFVRVRIDTSRGAGNNDAQ